MKNYFFCISLVGVLMACTSKPQREVIFTEAAPAPIGPYSQAIRIGNTVYVSGQVALHTTGKLDTSSIENECKQVLENIRIILDAAGMKPDNVCKASIFTTNLKEFSKINEVYKTYFKVDPPARETIEVKSLPKGAHLEISVIAQ